MKNRILLLPIAAMWGCTDYAGQWEDSYGVAFAQGSAPTAQVCAEGATTALSDDKCVTDFLCVNNTWVLQNYVCNGSVQQKICEENATTKQKTANALRISSVLTTPGYLSDSLYVQCLSYKVPHRIW